MSGIDIDPEWLWLIGGVVLLIAELIAPGFFLVFIGGAAIATGFASLLLPLSVPLQLAIFAVLAFLAARVGGRHAYAMRYDYSPDPFLNDRARRLL
jgi:membrane protein implicated in regulation of membrane protease activity